jgi:hypothetical protein
VIALGLGYQIQVYRFDSATGFGTVFAAPSLALPSGVSEVAFIHDDSVILLTFSGGSGKHILAYHWDNTTGFGAKFPDPSYDVTQGFGIAIC